ncbi:MAG: hypothetical protein D6812_05515, partial [Deltaproteobacteria bacterium]
TTQAKDDPIEYVHGELGYNYRLTNLQAALGVAQLEQLSDFIADKRRIAQRYRETLTALPGISMPEEAAWAESTWWLSTISIDATTFRSDSRTLLQRLLDRKIQCRPLWQPMHRSPVHANAFAYRIEHADRIHQEALSLPCSAGMTREEQNRVIEAIRDAAPR